MNGDRNSDNRAAIERYGDVRVVGELTPIPSLTAGALAEWAMNELRLDLVASEARA
jgi:hypothetical protein